MFLELERPTNQSLYVRWRIPILVSASIHIILLFSASVYVVRNPEVVKQVYVQIISNIPKSAESQPRVKFRATKAPTEFLPPVRTRSESLSKMERIERREQPKPIIELKFDPNHDPGKLLPEMIIENKLNEPTTSELKRMVSLREPGEGPDPKTGDNQPKGGGGGGGTGFAKLRSTYGGGVGEGYGTGKGSGVGSGEGSGVGSGKGSGIGSGTGSGKGKGRGSGTGRGGGGGGGLGGGGGGGLRDRLGMINFLDERNGPKKVVYLLDVSASMGAAGLKKIDLAVDALKDSVLLLNESDEFNIIAFADRVDMMRSSMLPAEMSNIQKAIKYLSQFTRDSIAENLGTSILPAIEAALKLQPDIVVLITDAQITPGHGREDISQEPKAILEAIRTKNSTNTVFYCVGLEANSVAVKLLQLIAQQTNGKVQIIKSDELEAMSEVDSLPRL